MLFDKKPIWQIIYMPLNWSTRQTLFGNIVQQCLKELEFKQNTNVLNTVGHNTVIIQKLSVYRGFLHKSLVWTNCVVW